MIYQAYQAQADGMVPLRTFAEAAIGMFSQPLPGGLDLPWSRNVAAACQLIASAGLSHKRPSFEIDKVRVGNQEVAVREEAVQKTPFCTLLHFRKEIDAVQPRVLLVAPMSGHFATLLRDTVRTMLADHDVYLTDWHNARDVAAAAGSLRLRRVHRTSDPVSSSISARARTSWRCASLASRRLPPSR